MTDKKDDAQKAQSAGTPQAKPSDPKRPHATLDLKAIEVVQKPVQSSTATAAEPAKSEANPASSATTTTASGVKPDTTGSTASAKAGG